MIASHNTFSYLKSSWFVELFSPLWRCQSISADKQHGTYNVECCDIRVRYSKGKWRLCHGYAKFGQEFNSLISLIEWCMSFNFSSFRLMYETRDTGYQEFIEEWKHLPKWMYDTCICAIYNPDWLFLEGSSERLIEHNKHMWDSNKSLWKNIKNLLPSTIKSYAKNNNAIYDDDKIHMYDYVQFIKPKQ